MKNHPTSDHALVSLLLGLLLTGTISAFPSIAQVKRDAGDDTKAQHETSGADIVSWSYVTTTYVATNVVTGTSIYSTIASGSEEDYTTTYIATDLSTVTTVISSAVGEPSPPSPTCQYSLGETPCGNLCCSAGQYCESSGTCKDAGGGNGGGGGGIITLCGYYGQLTCAEGEVCTTDAQNQARCVPSGSGGCSIPCGLDGQVCCSSGELCSIGTSTAKCVTTPPTCPLSTTVYTTTSSYQSTILDTITVVITRVESGVETIVRTAVFSPYPQLCLAELGQTQCGDVCCGPGQFCQSAGVCASQGCPPLRPTSESLVTITTDILTTFAFQTPVATTS